MVQLATMALAAALIILPHSAASSQGFFDTLFGAARRSPPPAYQTSYQPYAPPSPFSFFSRQTPAPRYGSRSKVYCVRLCDGRYFPIARHAGASAAETCHSFCPASQTKTFSGGNISYARASDGTRYSDLDNAFAYRKQVVAGCTCNGRNAFGLAPVDPVSDPTLRKGDIVATRDGFMAYRGRERASGERNFTPIESYSALSDELQRRLSETKIVPAPAASMLPVDDAAALGSAAGRQAQLFR